MLTYKADRCTLHSAHREVMRGHRGGVVNSISPRVQWCSDPPNAGLFTTSKKGEMMVKGKWHGDESAGKKWKVARRYTLAYKYL